MAVFSCWLPWVLLPPSPWCPSSPFIWEVPVPRGQTRMSTDRISAPAPWPSQLCPLASYSASPCTRKAHCGTPGASNHPINVSSSSLPALPKIKPPWHASSQKEVLWRSQCVFKYTILHLPTPHRICHFPAHSHKPWWQLVTEPIALTFCFPQKTRCRLPSSSCPLGTSHLPDDARSIRDIAASYVLRTGLFCGLSSTQWFLQPAACSQCEDPPTGLPSSSS